MQCILLYFGFDFLFILDDYFWICLTMSDFSDARDECVCLKGGVSCLWWDCALAALSFSLFLVHHHSN